MMPAVPADWLADLATAAQEHRFALEPATPAQITATLMAMRSSTQRRNETVEEAKASFQALVRELADVPHDILETACRSFIRTERFFPRAPSELLRFTGPLLAQRRRRAQNLERLAAEALAQKEREAQLKGEAKATVPDLLELIRNPTVPRSILATYVERGWADQSTVDEALAQAASDPAE